MLFAEPGAAEAGALWDEAEDVVTASIAYVEIRSAIARRLRGSAQVLARRRAADRWREVIAVAVDAELVRSAGDVAAQFRLRALDAVHLAAARKVAEREFLFATWDAELGRAAQQAGFAVAPA